MSRRIRVAAAQLGPILRKTPREETIRRLTDLLLQGHLQGVDLVVFPEAALTAFFPHWLIEDERELDSYFEDEMPGQLTRQLFDAARELRVGFYLGFAERVVENGRVRRFNSAVLVGRSGEIIGKYRKIHLPGQDEYRPGAPFQNLERRYFEIGDLGFPVFEAFGTLIGLCICNDRRWPETYRVMALKGAELILLGYNTPKLNPDSPGQPPELRLFHNHLCLQAGAYHNSAFVVGAAKAGLEEGCDMMGGSAIVGPDGTLLAVAGTESDELVVADCDFDQAAAGRAGEFNFARNRRPEAYGGLL